jgi:hypothetical protein
VNGRTPPLLGDSLPYQPLATPTSSGEERVEVGRSDPNRVRDPHVSQLALRHEIVDDGGADAEEIGDLAHA